MKLRKLFWIGMVLIPLLACEDVEETLETATELNVPIPLEATLVENTFSTKSSPIDQFKFEGIASFCLANKDKVKNCPGNIIRIVPGNGAELIFDGLGEYQQISSLTLEWGYCPAGSIDFHLQEPVEILPPGELINQAYFSLNLDEVLEPVIQKMNTNPKMFIMVKISGNSNFDISLDAQLKVPMIVQSEMTSPRFTL